MSRGIVMSVWSVNFFLRIFLPQGNFCNRIYCPWYSEQTVDCCDQFGNMGQAFNMGGYGGMQLCLGCIMITSPCI